MDYEALTLHILDRTARIVLSRPHADLRLLRDLAAACEAIDASTDICVALVTSDREVFCEGWDAATHDTLLATPEEHPDPFGCLARLPCPVLAAVHGKVIGAGLELALACDIRVARADAVFAVPDVAEGRMPVGGASARLPRIAGRSVATSMLLLGEALDAEAAYRAGIVSRVLPTSTFTDEVEAIVARIAANGPIALRYAKEAVHNGIELPLDQALRYELDLSVILQTTRDRAEGVRAFLDKRDPRFENR